jgi:hypothetical protein
MDEQDQKIHDLETELSTLNGGGYRKGQAETEEEYRLRHRQEDREDNEQRHNFTMEHLSFAGLCIIFIVGVFLYSFNPKGETIGTALMTGPAGALIDRSASAAIKKKREKRD